MQGWRVPYFLTDATQTQDQLCKKKKGTNNAHRRKYSISYGVVYRGYVNSKKSVSWKSLPRTTAGIFFISKFGDSVVTSNGLLCSEQGLLVVKIVFYSVQVAATRKKRNDSRAACGVEFWVFLPPRQQVNVPSSCYDSFLSNPTDIFSQFSTNSPMYSLRSISRYL